MITLKEKNRLEQSEYAIIKTQLGIQSDFLINLIDDLYGNIGQILSSTKMLIGLTEKGLAEPPGTLLKAHELLGKAISDLRLLCRPHSANRLDRFRFIETLEAEIDRINHNESVNLVSCSYSGMPVNLAACSQLILFSIVQEVLKDIMKHSDSTRIHIGIENTVRSLKITVTGTGPDKGKITGDSGGAEMANIRDRAKLLGGNMTRRSIQDKGTQLIITIPFRKNKKTTVCP